jgi:uncharacterized protein
MTALLDGNVLVALVVADHVHHQRARAWFDGSPFATCPITQGTLLRVLLREDVDSRDAMEVLAGVTRHPAHQLWADSFGYDEVPMHAIIGHRQVPDAYLAQLARSRAGRLATLDEGLAALHADVADLVPGG